MKRKTLYTALLFMIAVSSQAIGQDTYEIIRIYNATSITIGNQKMKVGDLFRNTDSIRFASLQESFLAQKKGTSKTYYFNKAAMESKKAKTLKDYFINDYAKVKGSSRGNSGNCPAISYGEYDVSKYPERRIALVIGNSNYSEASSLPNAINDVRDVSTKLNQLGFDVITLYDGNINDMQTSISYFFSLARSYQVALIYFAGHGIRYEGKDYLLSIDRGNMSIKDECSLDYLVEESERWKYSNNVMIFVIDACRDKQGFDYENDYRTIEAKKGTAILQSTSSGDVAMDSDRNNANSPFAVAFIEGIGKSGNDIDNEFFAIRQNVRDHTKDHQVPRTSLGGGYNFCFCRGCNNEQANNNKNLSQEVYNNTNIIGEDSWIDWENDRYWGVSYSYSTIAPLTLSIQTHRHLFYIGLDMGFRPFSTPLASLSGDTSFYNPNGHSNYIIPYGYVSIVPGINLNYVTFSCGAGLVWGETNNNYSFYSRSIESCFIFNPNVILHIPMPKTNNNIHFTINAGYNFVQFIDGKDSELKRLFSKQSSGFKFGIGAEIKFQVIKKKQIIN